MRNKILAVLLSAIVSLYLGVLPVHAETAQKTVDGMDVNGAVYAPVDAIITDMGGTAKLDSDKFYMFAINNKKLYVPTTLSFAEVDGKFVPYGTKTVGGFTVPVYTKPVEKGGEVYVPADFLKSSMGLDLSVKDGKITFDAKADTAAGTKPDTNKANSSDEKNRPDTGNTDSAGDETKSGTDKTNSSDDRDADKANSPESDKSAQNADSNGSQSDSNDNSSGSSSGTITAPTPPKAPTAPTAPKVPAAGTR